MNARTRATGSANILVTGADGQLGTELRRALAKTPGVFFATRADLDLADADKVRTFMRKTRPHLVINTAAYTAVDRAESEPELAMAANGEAPRIMAEELQQHGGAMIQVSTDYVFDGTKDVPYVETDEPNPLSVYGASKLVGERAVADACAAHWTLRTSWVFGTTGGNFLKTVLRVAETRDTMRVVADQHGVPTSASAIADAICTMLELDRNASPEALIATVAKSAGIYHVSSEGATTWHEYAVHVAQTLHRTQAHRPWMLQPQAIEAIDAAEYPTPAMRPKNSLLDHAKLARAFDVRLPPWQMEVDACIARLLGTTH